MGSPGMQERLGNDDSEWCECEGELWFAAASLPAPSVRGEGAGLTQLPDLLAPTLPEAICQSLWPGQFLAGGS